MAGSWQLTFAQLTGAVDKDRYERLRLLTQTPPEAPVSSGAMHVHFEAGWLAGW